MLISQPSSYMLSYIFVQSMDFAFHIHPGNNNNDKREDYGYVHLGIAVGTSEYKMKILQQRISELEKEADTLNLLKDPQQQWVFLLWVLRQKFSFQLRHYSPTITYYQSDRIDNVLSQDLYFDYRT